MDVNTSSTDGVLMSVNLFDGLNTFFLILLSFSTKLIQKKGLELLVKAVGTTQFPPFTLALVPFTCLPSLFSQKKKVEICEFVFKKISF